MAKRFFLDSVRGSDRTTWFTLVVENPAHFFVESYVDSPRPFLAERLRNIQPNELANYEVNCASLRKLVEAKLIEIEKMGLVH